jgi:predicted nucleotidyltransferase
MPPRPAAPRAEATPRRKLLEHRIEDAPPLPPETSVGARALRPSAILEQHRAAVSRRRATNPRLFGSALVGSDHATSNLDLFVDALPGATLFDLGGLKEDLEALLGLRVDVLPPLSPSRNIATLPPLGGRPCGSRLGHAACW